MDRRLGEEYVQQVLSGGVFFEGEESRQKVDHQHVLQHGLRVWPGFVVTFGFEIGRSLGESDVP